MAQSRQTKLAPVFLDDLYWYTTMYEMATIHTSINNGTRRKIPRITVTPMARIVTFLGTLLKNWPEFIRIVLYSLL
ncbi:MAG TPA: hypothetical protein VJ771_05910 [Candidatus Nitrosotalea sp.]|nr:hypothetical protein [Candidatus Nitrosotalea sp.]